MPGSFLLAIKVSITSFTDGSVEIEFSCWLCDFFWKLYICPSFPSKHFIASVLTSKSLWDLIGWDVLNERVHVGNV